MTHPLIGNTSQWPSAAAARDLECSIVVARELADNLRGVNNKNQTMSIMSPRMMTGRKAFPGAGYEEPYLLLVRKDDHANLAVPSGFGIRCARCAR